jgi:hypothetical protein
MYLFGPRLRHVVVTAYYIISIQLVLVEQWERMLLRRCGGSIWLALAWAFLASVLTLELRPWILHPLPDI